MTWSGQICLFLGLKKLWTVNKKNWVFFSESWKKFGRCCNRRNPNWQIFRLSSSEKWKDSWRYELFFLV
jgi:hypothetical protein